jgi:hypothetical protein
MAITRSDELRHSRVIAIIIRSLNNILLFSRLDYVTTLTYSE